MSARGSSAPPADPYPESELVNPAAFIVEEERRALYDQAGAVFETDHTAVFTWLPPSADAQRLERWLFGALEAKAGEAQGALERFQREIETLIDLLGSALLEARRLGDEELLGFLHGAVSTDAHFIARPDTPVFLDVMLADEPLVAGARPKLGEHHLRTVSLRAYPSRTLPGLLDGLGDLPFAYRSVVRWIALDRPDAEREVLRLRRQWFSKRKGLGVLLREAVTKEEVPLLDTASLTPSEAKVFQMAQPGPQ